MHKVTLVTGGGRSGKSRFAEELAAGRQQKFYIATAEIIDNEMANRITRHRTQRGNAYTTIEEPLDLAGAILAVQTRADLILVDCLTVWLGNLLHHFPELEYPYPQVEHLLKVLAAPPCAILLVSNEVGSGIIPADATTRRYRDYAGWLNQAVAAVASDVALVSCGLPLWMKQSPDANA